MNVSAADRASLQAIVREMAEQARHAAPSDATDESLSRLIASVPVAALIADSHGRFVAANSASATLTGYTIAELRQLSVWQITPAVGEHDAETLWRVFLQQHIQHGNYQIVRKDGRLIAAEYAAFTDIVPGRHVSLIRERSVAPFPYRHVSADAFKRVTDALRTSARTTLGADGVTLVLRDGDGVVYVEEDAIGPLWKGQRFPQSQCVSGWVIQRAAPAVIRDVFVDGRVPHDAYRSTFVRSMAMVPVGGTEPVGAIGAYWANPHEATESEMEILAALADSVWLELRE